MLVLSRRTNERVVFPSIATRIQVVAIKAGIVRLGIEAPASIPIYREELLGREGFTDAATGLNVPSGDAEIRLHRLTQSARTYVAEALHDLEQLRLQLESSGQPPAPGTLAHLETQLRRLERLVA